VSNSDLIDVNVLTDARTALICARLHLRSGKRRLQKGLETAGIAALYDSVLFGMHHYIAKHKGCASILKDTDLWDLAGMFHALARLGVFDDPLLFNRFSLTVEHALWQRSSAVDGDVILREAEEMLTRLGVMRKHPEKEIQL
jgi:hypothetical protein